MYEDAIKEAIERLEQDMKNLEKQMDGLLPEIDKSGNEKCSALTQYDKLREDYYELKKVLDMFKDTLNRCI